MHHNNHGRSKSFNRSKCIRTTPTINLPEPLNINLEINKSKLNRYGKVINLGSGTGGSSRKMFKGLSLLKQIKHLIAKINGTLLFGGYRTVYNTYTKGKKFRRVHHRTSDGRVVYVNHRGRISY